MTYRTAGLSRRNENSHQNNITGGEVPSRHSSSSIDQSLSSKNHSWRPQRVWSMRRIPYEARYLLAWQTLSFLGLIGLLCSWGGIFSQEYRGNIVQILPRSMVSSSPEFSPGLITQGNYTSNLTIAKPMPRHMIDGQVRASYVIFL